MRQNSTFQCGIIPEGEMYYIEACIDQMVKINHVSCAGLQLLWKAVLFQSENITREEAEASRNPSFPPTLPALGLLKRFACLSATHKALETSQ